MAQNSKIKEFPEISNKLTAPSKKSVFERQKAEAEAKRQREQQETAAVYEDFIKSFDDEDGDAAPGGSSARAGVQGGGALSGGFSKRHFSGPQGPASRGGFGSGRGSSGPGSLGPPPPLLSRKRAHDGSQPTQREGLFAFEDASTGPADPKTALQHSDDEDTTSRARSERIAPKPTLRLSSLPPGTSPAAIKAFIPSTLTVDGVRIIPPSGPGSIERRSLSAVVTLVKDTPALDIDTAVSALQNRYMGRGFYLSLSRHLSSAAVGLDAPSLGLSSSSSSLPFGARPIAPPNLGRAPPSGPHRGGYAPPSSYESAQTSYGRGAPKVQVNVNAPSDLKQIKLIHKTLEALLTHGPEFEALLMSRKDVQTYEKWAWLWDSSSTGGVYYRWRLWDVLTGASKRRRRNFSTSSSQLIFEGGAAWAMPEQKLPFEYATRFDEFISDSDYDSSEDDDSGDEGRRRYAHHHGGAPPPEGHSLDTDTQAYLNPFQKAKLTHLLARLPNSNAKLRRGDVARVTAFAIQHAGEGADEVVEMITSNVKTPFSFTGANPNRQSQNISESRENDLGDDSPATNTTPKHPTQEKEKEKGKEKGDSTPSKLIALYLISDILSTSSISGVRHAWRYRQLFEASLKKHATFEHLGRLEKEHSWGRLRAEKWKRSVMIVLGLWEGWCVFPQSSQEHFNNVFLNPPMTAKEEEEAKASEKERAEKEKSKSKWKTVDEKAAERAAADAAEARAADAMEIDDVDGEPMAEDDFDGEVILEEDVDGEPMAASSEDEALQNQPEGENEDAKAPAERSRREALAASIASKLGKSSAPIPGQGSETAGTGVARKRQRPKAEDMFADSDGE